MLSHLISVIAPARPIFNRTASNSRMQVPVSTCHCLPLHPATPQKQRGTRARMHQLRLRIDCSIPRLFVLLFTIHYHAKTCHHILTCYTRKTHRPHTHHGHQTRHAHALNYSPANLVSPRCPYVRPPPRPPYTAVAPGGLLHELHNRPWTAAPVHRPHAETPHTASPQMAHA